MIQWVDMVEEVRSELSRETKLKVSAGFMGKKIIVELHEVTRADGRLQG